MRIYRFKKYKGKIKNYKHNEIVYSYYGMSDVIFVNEYYRDKQIKKRTIELKKELKGVK